MIQVEIEQEGKEEIKECKLYVDLTRIKYGKSPRKQGRSESAFEMPQTHQDMYGMHLAALGPEI